MLKIYKTANENEYRNGYGQGVGLLGEQKNSFNAKGGVFEGGLVLRGRKQRNIAKQRPFSEIRLGQDHWLFCENRHD